MDTGENIVVRYASIYVYNRDQSILYYFTDDREKFLRDTKLHYSNFEKHLKKGTFYLGRYLFTRNFVSTAMLKGMTLPEFALKLEQDRKKKFNKN